jgi:hypothetical protein
VTRVTTRNRRSGYEYVHLVRESVEKVWAQVANATPALDTEPTTDEDVYATALSLTDERGLGMSINLRLEAVVAVEAVPISRPPNATKADFLAAERRRRAQQ